MRRPYCVACINCQIVRARKVTNLIASNRCPSSTIRAANRANICISAVCQITRITRRDNDVKVISVNDVLLWNQCERRNDAALVAPVATA